MKAAIVAALALTVAAVGATATAAPSAWRPGAPYLISEEDASSWLEKTYDHAYCQGIPRFGHSGEFPYEEFVYFDCTVEWDRYTCVDARWRAIKGKRRGYFRMRSVRQGDCF